MNSRQLLRAFGLVFALSNVAHAQLLQRAQPRLTPPPTKAVAGNLITSVNVSTVGPNDPLLVKGHGFGAQEGRLRIGIAPGRFVDANLEAWSDTVVVARMPDVGGIPLPFHGELVLERQGADPLKVAMTFQPAVETRTLLAQGAEINAGSPSDIEENVCHPKCHMGVNPGLLVGGKGDDRFFQGRRLKNGWKVSSVSLASVSGRNPTGRSITDGRAEARITEQYVGTDNPQVSVHWWYDAFGSVGYLPVIVITGPKGVPHW